MTLPEPIMSFWTASLELNARVLHTDWGVVVTDPRYPRVYEANHASVLRPPPDLALHDVRAKLLPALEEAGATHEHIEFMDAEDDCPALRDLFRSPGDNDPDVLMIYEGDSSPDRGFAEAEPPPGVGIEQIADLDETFWRLYRSVPDAYGEPLPDDVLDQMLRRTQAVFFPQETFFVGIADGALAGVVSVQTLEGVAYIDNVVTLSAYRRRGIASAAVARAVATSLDAGAGLVFLLAEENGAPQRLYERLGFRVRRRCHGFTRPLPGRSHHA